MRKLALVILLLGAACASRQPGQDNAPVPVPPGEEQQARAAMDARITALQTSMTELLDRIDVLNDRMNRMENLAALTQPRAEASAPAPHPETVSAAAKPGQAAPAVVQPVAPAPTSGIPRALVSAQIADTYRNALMLYGRGRMDESRRTFQQVFDADPTGDLADNALYWIGETWYAAGNYSEAMRYYHRVTTEYAEQNKAPDAMFKTALAYEKTSDLGMARTTLEEVIRRYPYSTAAASAKLELRRIKY